MQWSWSSHVAGCATFAAAAIFARLFLAPEPNVPAFEANLPSGDLPLAQRELMAAVDHLRESIEALNERARAGTIERSSSAPAESSGAAPVASFDERLDRWIVSLEETLSRIRDEGFPTGVRDPDAAHPTDTAALERFFAQYPIGEQEEQSETQALQEFFGLTPRDIFRRFGAATVAQPENGGMLWIYRGSRPNEQEDARELFLRFMDGLLIGVDL